MHFYKQQEYKMIDILKDRYDIKSLCDYLEINRIGHYKWINNKIYRINQKNLM